MPVNDAEHREALTRAGDAEAEAYALRDDLRRIAVALGMVDGDQGRYVFASAPEMASRIAWLVEADDMLESLRGTVREHLPRYAYDDGTNDEADEHETVEYAADALRKVTRERGEARAIIRATCDVLGDDATGHLARDVAGLVATLRETQHALARAREWGVNALQREAHRRLVAAWDARPNPGGGFELYHAVNALDDAANECRAAEVSDADHARDVATLREMRGRPAAMKVGDRVRCRVGDVIDRTGVITDVDADDPGLPYRVEYDEGGSIWLRANEVEAPPVEVAAVEAPHRVGDVWRSDESDTLTMTVAAIVAGEVSFDGRTTASAEWWQERGWRRVRCAPAVGDAVRVDGPGADLEMAGRGEAANEDVPTFMASYELELVRAERDALARDLQRAGVERAEDMAAIRKVTL